MSIRNVTLRQLRIFEAVAAERSFSRAAERLHLTQPGVSMHVRDLEARAGLPLIERLGRRFELTEAGRDLLDAARGVTRALEEAQQRIDALQGLRRGRLDIAIISTAKYFAPRLLAAFQARYPDASIRLAVSNRTQVIDQLHENRVDLAIMGRPPDGGGMSATAFADNPQVIVAAPDHPLVGARSIEPARVAAERFLVRESGSGTRLAMEAFFREAGVAAPTGMEMASNETIKQAVMAGMGLSFLSRHTIDLEVETGRIVVLDVRGLPVTRRWHVAQRSDKRLMPIAEAFRRFALREGPALLAAGVEPRRPPAKRPRAR